MVTYSTTKSTRISIIFVFILSSSTILLTFTSASRSFSTSSGPTLLFPNNLYDQVSSSSRRRRRQHHQENQFSKDNDDLTNILSWKSQASSSAQTTCRSSSRRRGQLQTTLLSDRSRPSLNQYSNDQHHGQCVLETSTKRKRRRTSAILEQLSNGKEIIEQIHPREQLATGGFYYGVSEKTMNKANTAGGGDGKRRKVSKDDMSEALLEELKYLRIEMERMRQDMQTLKQRMIEDGEIIPTETISPEELKAKALALTRKKQKQSEKLAKEIEEWAKCMLDETTKDGWKEVPCGKQKSLNPTDRTSAYLKWMKDSRGDKALKTDENEYPCIKCYSTIDAPLEDVCTYLSQESSASEYNDVVVKFKDIEEISPNAKITWSQSPQILFLKPREFITFCHHRWSKDGSCLIVNQAWDHPDYPATNDENSGDGKSCRALALRGANFLSRDPDDPEKTRVIIVAHANPGGNFPKWATKTAVNALAPIEPYKLFHKINASVQTNKEQIRQRYTQQAEMVSTLPQGRTPRPAGIAQLGYACFWPNGGGIDIADNYKKKLQQNPPTTADGDTESREEETDSGLVSDSNVGDSSINNMAPNGAMDADADADGQSTSSLTDADVGDSIDNMPPNDTSNGGMKGASEDSENAMTTPHGDEDDLDESS